MTSGKLIVLYCVCIPYISSRSLHFRISKAKHEPNLIEVFVNAQARADGTYALKSTDCPMASKWFLFVGSANTEKSLQKGP